MKFSFNAFRAAAAIAELTLLPLLLLLLPLALPQPSIAEIDSQTDRLTFKQHFCIERI